MGKKLVIVESPTKVKTISKILGSDYEVRSSMGHIRDLPVRSLGVDVEHGFEPKYVVVKGRRSLVTELKKAAKSADAIYLAPDPDREGEAIAWHLQELLSGNKEADRFHRVQYNEITPGAVRAAFEHPGELDMKRVEAQQSRRILDRIVGYKVSPMLWRRIKRGLSAGRVQSVALRLVCERETEITNFVPQPYWILGAKVRKLVAPLDPFVVELSSVNGEKISVTTPDTAESILSELEGRSLTVSKIATKELVRRAPPPFITSSLQQAASGRFGFAPRRTMMVAQKLYEGKDLGEGPTGLITYMRTDSFAVSQDAQNACRDYITSTFGREYCPEQPNRFRSRASAQEAHEAIRPTDIRRTPKAVARHLDASELKLYRMIWERFVASQMSPAKIERRTVDVEAPPAEGDAGNVYGFQATDSRVVFPGFMKVSGIPAKAKSKVGKDGEKETPLPPLAEGEPLTCLEWLSERKETKPPPRYSEASLVRALERNGIGRPSTYAQIVATLSDRKYVKREKKTLFPTPLGMEVNDLLTSTLDELFNVKFTAAMEDKLDNVEKGTVAGGEMLQEFYSRFTELMSKTRLPPADADMVARALAELEQIQDWAPEVKRGKRTYSDQRFVASVREQLEAGEKPISQRQLEALLKMGVRYREQVPGIMDVLKAADRLDLLDAPDTQPPRETSLRKIGLLRKVELDESTEKFVNSLNARMEQGRRLTEAQSAALDKIVLSRSEQIPDFESIKDELDIAPGEEQADRETQILVEAMGSVKEWKPPTKRGKKVFNDESFFGSLASQYKTRGSLSPRQRAALKRLARRYRAQIPNYEQIADACGLTKKRAEES